MRKNACLRFFKVQVKGSSILEVLISLTICMIIFTISMRVILNIQTNNNIETRQRAILLFSRDRMWFDSIPDEVSKDKYIEDRNLLVQSDTSLVDQLPELELVTQTIKLKDGRSVIKGSFYVRKTITGKP